MAIILTITDDGVARCFDYTIDVANDIDSLFLNNNLYIFPLNNFAWLIKTKFWVTIPTKLLVMCNDRKTTNFKNDNGSYTEEVFQNIHNTLFNFMASNGFLVDTGNCLLNYMHGGKKKPYHMTPQYSYPLSESAASY